MKVLVLAALAALAVAAPVATADTMKPQVVRTIHDAKLGNVVTTATRQAIYTWTREPKGTIRCTGACARMWPPVLVRRGVVVPMHVAGIMGDLGTIRRPDGMRQLTLDRRALYTYADEKPGQVLCNDVDGWFAVKA
jgi:predicted lipoprotein with Yx(FWY)xxD motif